MDGDHLGKGNQSQVLKVKIGASLKNGSLLYLCMVAFSGLKPYFANQIDSSRTEKPIVDIGAQGTDRHFEFRVIGDNLVG